MTVSSSFVIYQLHWNSKQIRRSRRDTHRLKEQTRIDAMSKKLAELSGGANIPKFSKVKALMQAAKKMQKVEDISKDIRMHDPYVLNDK